MSGTQTRGGSKDVREMVDLLRSLGYESVRRGAHLIFDHPDHPNWRPISLASTPSDNRWKANMLADIRRRHPEVDDRRKSANRRSSSQRAKARKRKAQRASVILAAAPARTAPVVADALESDPRPGSPEAVALGCWCPVFENRHGVGIDGEDGVFVYVKGCPLPSHDREVPEVDRGPRCECGNPLPARAGRGRPRKYCEECRPSEWHRLTEEQREIKRARVRDWYSRHHRTEREAA